MPFQTFCVHGALPLLCAHADDFCGRKISATLYLLAHCVGPPLIAKSLMAASRMTSQVVPSEAHLLTVRMRAQRIPCGRCAIPRFQCSQGRSRAPPDPGAGQERGGPTLGAPLPGQSLGRLMCGAAASAVATGSASGRHRSHTRAGPLGDSDHGGYRGSSQVRVSATRKMGRRSLAPESSRGSSPPFSTAPAARGWRQLRRQLGTVPMREPCPGASPPRGAAVGRAAATSCHAAPLGEPRRQRRCAPERCS